MLSLPRSISWLVRGFGFLLVLVILSFSLRWGSYGIHAEIALNPVEEIRTLYPSEWGGEYPSGLAYSANLRQFFSIEGDDSAQSSTSTTSISSFTPYEELVGTMDLPFAIATSVNIAYEDGGNRLLLLSPDLTELIQVKVDSSGALNVSTVTRYAIGQLGLKSAQGMVVDGEGKRLFILDASASQIVKIALQNDLGQVEFEKIALAPELDLSNVQGISLNPVTRNLFLLDRKAQLLYEVAQSGELLSRYDLSTLGLADPRAVAFAPSADLTDDPSTVHLFISDSGEPQNDVEQTFPFSLYLSFLGVDQEGSAASGETAEVASAKQQSLPSQIVEVTLDPADVVRVAAIDVVVLPLVQTIDTSQFDKPSTDPSGLAYIRNNTTPPSGRLLIVDGEVDEFVAGNPVPTYFEGANLFYVGIPDTTMVQYGDTLDYTDEPVGVAYDPATQLTYISTDTRSNVSGVRRDRGVYIVNASGDEVGYFSTEAFNSLDPEGLEIINGVIYIADGTNREIYRVDPNGNGFDGVPPAGNDLVTSFDTAQEGLNDPSGLGVDPNSGNLLLVDSNNNSNNFFELTTEGVVVQTYDVQSAGGRRLDGIVMAPSSQDTTRLSYYIADRGVDADSGKPYNDGKIYEMGTPGGPVNSAPVANDDSATTTEDTAVIVNVVANDVDSNLDPASIEVVTPPSPSDGTLVKNDNGTFTYTPAVGFTGIVTFTYTVCDSGSPALCSNEATVTITVNADDPPNPPCSSASDLIFCDGFESGDFSAWSSNQTDNGDLSVSAAAKLVGSFGMQAVIDDNRSIFVTDDSPNGERRYRVGFYFDPNSISMSHKDNLYIFRGLAGAGTPVLQVPFRSYNGAYQIRVALRNDSSQWISSSWFPISDEAHFIELDWQAATGAGANNGGLTVWIDGDEKASVQTVDNDTRVIDSVRLGAVAGIDSGTQGASYFDAFESRRETAIGTAIIAQPNTDETVDSEDLNIWTEEEDEPDQLAPWLFLPFVQP